MTKTIKAEDREHVESLLKWSANAFRRGDNESGERLLNAAHKVMSRAVAVAVS